MIAPVILSHPQEHSFNHAIARALEKKLLNRGYQIFFHDLYKENFDPVMKASEITSKYSFDLQVQELMEELELSDLLIFVHPDWWGQPPAILKGWIDRVLRPGVAYSYRGEENEARKLVPLLSDKKVRIFCTTDTRPEDDLGSLPLIWTKTVWNFCGIKDIQLQIHYNTRESGESARQQWIDNLSL